MSSHGLLHRILTLKRSTLYSEEKLIEGFLFATTFHALANVLFELSLGIIAVPLIVFGVWLVTRLYKTGQREDQRIVRKARLRIS
jgi:fatty acid desaturase